MSEEAQQLSLPTVGEPLAATSRLRARYAHLRASYPPTKDWPDKRCYYVARTLDETQEGYQRNGQKNKSDEVGTARANADPAVQAYLAEARAEQGRRFAYGAQSVLSDLWLATDMAMGRLPQKRAVIVQDKVLVDPETKETETRVTLRQLEVEETSLAHAKPLLELWLKHYGLIRERIEGDLSVGMPDLTEAQMLAQLNALGVDVSGLPSPVVRGDAEASESAE